MVLLDVDLATLYGVRTRHINQQVKRNSGRFPADFVFQVTHEEARQLNQIPRLRGQRGAWRYRPYAFTEPGAGMLAAVLRSPAATRISIAILRTFSRLRPDQEPASPPEVRAIRSLFAAIRDAVFLRQEDKSYTTDVPYTYFLQAGVDGPIKIGSTRNLPVRMRTLCAMSSVPLRLLDVIRGNVEDHCHVRLGASRLHGEWFAPSSTVLDFVRDHATRALGCAPEAHET